MVADCISAGAVLGDDSLSVGSGVPRSAAGEDVEPHADSHWQQLVEELQRPLTAMEHALGQHLTPPALRKVGGLLAAGLPAELILQQLREAFQQRQRPRPGRAAAHHLEDLLGRPLSEGEAVACSRLSDRSFCHVQQASAAAGVVDPEELLAEVRRHCFARRGQRSGGRTTTVDNLQPPLPALLAEYLQRCPTAMELHMLHALTPAGVARLSHALQSGMPAETCLTQMRDAFVRDRMGSPRKVVVLEAVDVCESDGEESDQEASATIG
eukprot:GGOE01014254.1.p1 GENE.GGOE01014254.1~~GGOE01014254.1.p1  ORF type:complete len:279 (-),score=54.27 GGOE01014254.1:310-1113(-)